MEGVRMNAVMEMDPVMVQKTSNPYTSSNLSKQDKYLSFFVSALIHASIILIAMISFIKPPVFAVDHGVSSIEVNLVAAPSEVVTPQPPPMPPVPVKSEFVVKQIVKPVTKVVTSIIKKDERKIIPKTRGKGQATAQSARGAVSEAKPDYLNNPAPVYPEIARQLGYEGIVFLTADIDKSGMPVKVEIEKSSGHSQLDEAALKAVKTWKFRPGEFGNMPIESVVRVPIKFYLGESK
jgi:protein TonB